MTKHSQNQARVVDRPVVLDPRASARPHPSHHPVQLKSGAWVVLRPVVPDDAPQLVAMHERLSPTSRYQRYMRPHLPDLAEMEALGRLHPNAGEAFVAESLYPQTTIVGLIYYIREEPPEEDQAEFGVTVEDGFQGGGLGRALLDHMCESARINGVRRMEANVLPQNRKMLHLLESCQRPLQKSLSTDFITATLDLGLDAQEAQLMCLLADAAASPRPSASAVFCQ